MNNWQLESFRNLDSHSSTAIKTSELASQKTLFSFKTPICNFHEKIIRSTLTIYVADLGIDVVIIGVAQQRKPKFSLQCKILTELCNLPGKNIPFFQNADSQFLINTAVRSI